MKNSDLSVIVNERISNNFEEYWIDLEPDFVIVKLNVFWNLLQMRSIENFAQVWWKLRNRKLFSWDLVLSDEIEPGAN